MLGRRPRRRRELSLTEAVELLHQLERSPRVTDLERAALAQILSRVERETNLDAFQGRQRFTLVRDDDDIDTPPR